MEAQPPCHGAGMLKGAQPPRSGSANHRAWAPELGMGLVQLPACRIGSALAVLLRFASVGLVWEYQNELGCAWSFLAGNHSFHAPWALSLPAPVAESLSFHLCILEPSSLHLPGSA